MPKYLTWIGVIAAVIFARANWHGYRPPIDLQVYWGAGKFLLNGTPLYSVGVPANDISLPFTYPPFAAVVFALIAWLPLNAVVILHHLACIVCAYLVVRWLGVPGFVLALMLCTQPGFSTLSFGQVNIFLMALVVADALNKRPRWLPRGFLIGVAAAIKVTPAIFVLYFLVRKDWRGVLGVMAGGAGATLLAAALRTHDSWQFFTHTLFDASRVGNPGYIHNASLNGILYRFGWESVFPFVAVVSILLGAAAARRAFQVADEALALMMVAGIGLLISPISWTHHWVWLVPMVMLPGMPKWLRWWTILALTAGTMVIRGEDWLSQVAVLQFSLIVFAAMIWALFGGGRYGRAISTATAPSAAPTA